MLSVKSDHWSYENEWRLIVPINDTIGTAETDRHDQPINLVSVPNEAVVSIYYTERTAPEAFETIEAISLLGDHLTGDRNGSP